MESKKTKCIATWWERDVDNPETEDVEVEVSFEDDAVFIDGLRQGVYLTLPLHAIAQAMADGTKPAKGLAR